jgi:hypothetical protein
VVRSRTTGSCPVLQRLCGLAVLPPGAPQAEDWGQPWPLDRGVQVGRGDQLAPVVLSPVSPVDRARLPLVA